MTEVWGMQIAMAGLGRMSANMVRWLLRGHCCRVYEVPTQAAEQLARIFHGHDHLARRRDSCPA